MKKVILCMLLFMPSFLTYASTEVSKKIELQGTVQQAVENIKIFLKSKDIKVIAEIDHSKAAKDVGLELEDNVLLIFGNPKVGSKLMVENSDLGFYLPLRAQVYKKENKVFLNITNLEFVKNHYQLKDSDNLKILEKVGEVMGGIEKAVKTLRK